MGKYSIPRLTEHTLARRYLRVAAFAVLGASIGALFMLHVYPFILSGLGGEEESATELPSEVSSVFPRAIPTHLSIPALTLEVDFEAPLGVDESGAIEVPESNDRVGWFENGASPGEIGPTVVLGHVDSYRGPAVFYSLGKLSQGDEVRITREDGVVAVYEVTNIERYAQEKFPTELVYGAVPYAALRLITCTGTYSHGEERYSHNLVVYGKLTRTIFPDDAARSTTGVDVQ